MSLFLPFMYSAAIPPRVSRMVTVSTLARIHGPFVRPSRSWPRHVRRPFTSSATTRDQGLKPPESALKVVPAAKSLRFPRTAACLIIGDEILSGKVADANSTMFVKWCFALGIELKKIEIVPDEENVIIESVQVLSRNFDFVVTSGGIGPTHDDITYSSIAKAFDLTLVYHEPTVEFFNERLRKRFSGSPTDSVKQATLRMALLPNPAEVVFLSETHWMPVVIANGNVHILPGVPALFKELLAGLRQRLLAIDDGRGSDRAFCRRFLKTSLLESEIAAVLTEVQDRMIKEGYDIKIGSYPEWGQDKVVVSFLGKGEREEQVVASLVEEVAGRIEGTEICIDDA